MLKYSLNENFLTQAPNDFMAAPSDVRVYDLKAIIQRIVARYPGLTPTQISAAIDEFFEEVCNITEEDNGIFLINESGVATKLAVIAENKPARLMAILPTGRPQGIYTVEVRTSYTTSRKPRKSVRIGSFYRQLTVN
jgi:hypothetical protein